MVIVIMGVSGSGKTTLGRVLAQHLGWSMLDCDDLHPCANIDKMRRGFALNDEDRAPWLAAVAERLRDLGRSKASAVVACSALKESYRRQILADCDESMLVYLKASRAQMRQRLQERRGHFMPAALVDSQFAALEEPRPEEKALELDARSAVASNVNLIESALELRKESGRVTSAEPC